MPDWDHSVDVLVAGSGGAGLVAAIMARDLGGSVLLAERSSRFGGTTAYSGGKIWIPNNHHMHRLGIADSREEALTYLVRATGGLYMEVLEAFVDTAPEMARYVEEHTPLKFYPCVNYPDYHPEWPGARAGGRALDAQPFDASCLGDYLPRIRRSPVFLPFTHEEWEKWRSVRNFDWALIGERVRNNVFTTGAAIVAALVKGCLDRGVDLRENLRVVRLITGDGRVLGVEAEDGGGRRLRLQARKGVILATGGFEWNDDLNQRFLRGPVEGAASPPWNEGDGIVMGAEVGAQLANMSEGWWMPLLQMPGEEADGRPLYRALISERGLPGSIIVNRQGRRFVNEAHNYNDISKVFHHFDPVAFDWPNIPAFLIFDDAFRSRYSIATVMPGSPVPSWVVQAATLRELAERIGVDGEQLEATVQAFNEGARRGVDPEFHRGESAYDRYYGDPSVQPNPCLAPLDTPPFYAIRVYAGTIGTKGGLVTDAHARVLDVRGGVIEGLYAAGNVAAFWAGRGYPGPGASIGPAMTFAYIAARHAMAG